MTVLHQLKSWPEFFEPVFEGRKPFELRRNDRDFQTGDHIVLREYEPREDRYTGREITKRVTYVLRGIGNVGTIAPYKGLSTGYAILGLADIE
jgi:hypothetical protein